ncbi:MAG: MFS transporter [Clostridium sp.]
MFKNSILFRNKQLLAIGISIMIFNLSYSVLIPIIPVFFGMAGMSTLGIGYIMSAYAGSKCMAQIPSGIVADLVGDKKILLIGLWLMGILMFGYTMTSSTVIIGVIYVLEGVVVGVATPAIYAVLGRSIEEGERGKSIGAFTSLSAFGFALGPLLSGVIVDGTKSYDLVFYLASFGTFLTSWFVVCFIKESHGQANKNNEEPKERGSILNLIMLANRSGILLKVIMLGSISFLGDFIYGSMVSVLPLYGKSILNSSITYISFLISVNFFIFSFSAPLVGWLSDKIGAKKQILVSLIIILIVFGVLSEVKEVVWFTAIIVIEFFLGSAMYSALQSLLSKYGENSNLRGVMYGAVGTFQSIGLALGPVVSVFIYEFNKGYYFIGLTLITGLVLIIFLVLLRVIDRNDRCYEDKGIVNIT